MTRIKLKTGAFMPTLGLGTWRMNGRKCISTVSTAIDLGYRHIDTAEMYGNELEIGKAIKVAGIDRRELFITTKIWPHNFQSKDFIKAFEISLRKLDTDYVDLLLLHWPNDLIPVEETLSAMANLIDSGKVRAGGVSNFSVSQMEDALDFLDSGIVCNQVRCHYGSVPRDIINYAHLHNLVITAYSPLKNGGISEIKILRDMADKYNKTPAQIALRWLIQQGVVVIPKASSFDRLNENLIVTEFSISQEDIEILGVI
ncbi:aldo/keto reductase [Rouxiella sp. WC2420]|uniref:Aldo/keto reductase n=1 Tax=Rouxiella sp. WC2420 TaxID=3234145 RepID=A0AB39VY97_9GAMM